MYIAFQQWFIYDDSLSISISEELEFREVFIFKLFIFGLGKNLELSFGINLQYPSICLYFIYIFFKKYSKKFVKPIDKALFFSKTLSIF